MSGEINILIEEIEAIAQQTRGFIAADAQQGAGEFASATLDAGAFAGIPPGLAFHAQQANAHEVYTEIINGVVADLEAFGAALAANAANHRAVDESNADTMTAMEARRADEQAASNAMDQVNQQYAEDPDLESQEVYEENVDPDAEAEVAATPQDTGSDPAPSSGGPDDVASAPATGPATGPATTPATGPDAPSTDTSAYSG